MILDRNLDLNKEMMTARNGTKVKLNSFLSFLLMENEQMSISDFLE